MFTSKFQFPNLILQSLYLRVFKWHSEIQISDDTFAEVFMYH